MQNNKKKRNEDEKKKLFNFVVALLFLLQKIMPRILFVTISSHRHRTVEE